MFIEFFFFPALYFTIFFDLFSCAVVLNSLFLFGWGEAVL
jgi:hypothetical protein